MTEDETYSACNFWLHQCVLVCMILLLTMSGINFSYHHLSNKFRLKQYIYEVTKIPYALGELQTNW